MSRYSGDNDPLARDRTWSSDSHLLPAGVRQEEDVPPQEPSVRPRQRREPPRDRLPQRVRFQDSNDDYDQYSRVPPRRPTPYAHGSHDVGPSRSARRQDSGPRYIDRSARVDLVREDELERTRQAIENEQLRIQHELELLRAKRELDQAQGRRRDSEDNRGPYPPPRPPPGSYPSQRGRMRTPSPPPVVMHRRRAVSVDRRPVRRVRSFSPPERFTKAELYSDPESYETRPTTGESSGYQPVTISSRPSPSPSPDRDGKDGDESDSSWSRSSATSDELYDEYNNRRIYEFNPSHLSRKASQDASTTLSESFGDGSTAVTGGSGEKGLGSSGPDPSVDAKALQPHRIYQSEYTGDGLPEGSHSVKLTAVLDSKRLRQPLFRWRHIQQSNMNFEELSDVVNGIGGLPDSERRRLNELLSKVKKYSIKSTPTSKGSSVKHMEPGYAKSTDPDTADRRSAKTAIWLCCPYFSLQKYAGPLSAATPGSFPTRTLLQEQYSGVSAERDMQQAVCQTGHVPPDMCFHVAQLWCIVLDNSLLITCGSMSDPTKKGDFSDILNLINEPSRDPASSTSSFIYVYYTEAVMYALPIDQCRSWFAFISHFQKFWPKTVKFTHRDHCVTATQWPAIFNLARLSSGKVLLVLKLGAEPQPPPRGVLNSLVRKQEDKDKDIADETESKSDKNFEPPNKGKPEQTADMNSPTDSDSKDDKFHVFSWLESFTATDDPSSQERAKSLQAQLQEMEDFVINETKEIDSKAYQSCQEATHLDALAYLEGLSPAAQKTPRFKRGFEDRVDVFNAAEIVFRFFLPLQTVGPTVGKYWGAIHRLLQMPDIDWTDQSVQDDGAGRRRRRADGENLLQTRVALRELTQQIQSFTNILSHAQPMERASITVPIELFRAWIYLLIALAKAAKNSFARLTQFEDAKDLIKDGMEEVIEALPGDDLLAREVVLPMEIVSLLCLRLLQDTTGAYPNLDAIYSEYLDALDNEVATKPSERSFEHRINLLTQEVTVINRIVGKQRRILSAITTSTIDFRRPLARRRAVDDDRYPSHTLTRHNNTREYITTSARERDRTPSPPRTYRMSSPIRDYRTSSPPVQHSRYSDPYAPHADRPHSYFQTQPAAIRADDKDVPVREYYRLSPTRPGGFRELLVSDCLSLIEQRYTQFSQLIPHANYLQEYNNSKFATTKDRQEQAIYAFTIVTVIFLPLSAVAGIFGMNTADVRDMAFSQWLYWATAVPVTILVILVGLWWMGELGNFFAWLPGWGRRDGYKVIGGGGNLRVAGRSEEEFSMPAMMVQRPNEDEIDVRVPVPRSSRPMIMRQRSGYQGDEYTTLEAGGARSGIHYAPRQRPWTD